MYISLKCLCATLLIFTSVQGYSQTNVLTLDRCYQLARDNYPAIKKLQLVTRSSDYDLANANKRYLPQISFSGQASYQSQTISFPDALGSSGLTLPSIDKDQYKIQGDVSQFIYDGGVTKNQKNLIKANTALQVQNLESSLYTIRQRVNSIYFSILLMEAQLSQNDFNIQNLQTQVQKTEAMLKNGVAFRSSLDELNAEIVTLDMAREEYRSNRVSYLNMLSLFIGIDLAPSVRLERPVSGFTPGNINRPELKAFDLQKTVYDAQEKQLRSDYLPQLSAFFQGAYGRPTLNIIENKFGAWYITGLKLSWSLGSLYTLSNKKEILRLNRAIAEADKETFLLNNNVDLAQQNEQVKKYTELIAQDEKAIALRASVTKSAEAQLNNGIITTHEYLQKVNAENLARQNKIMHEIQLLQANYNQKYLTGN